MGARSVLEAALEVICEQTDPFKIFHRDSDIRYPSRVISSRTPQRRQLAASNAALVTHMSTDLLNNFLRSLALVEYHQPLRGGGMSARQNLQGTVWLLLLGGTI